MLQTKEKIIKWLDKYGVSYYTIRDDLTVDVSVDVNLAHKLLDEIPIQFGIIDGSFYCEYNNLTSLKGCPIEVRGDFYCGNNKITTFTDSPKLVEGDFNCGQNHVTSINDFECRVLGRFIHTCYFGQPYKIQELKGYYKESEFNHAIMNIKVPGKELENIVCEAYLQKNLPVNEVVQKKLKL